MESTPMIGKLIHLFLTTVKMDLSKRGVHMKAPRSSQMTVILKMSSVSTFQCMDATDTYWLYHEDDPKKWKFGPQYRSDLIIVNARGISLV
jgi:hypothetical protein